MKFFIFTILVSTAPASFASQKMLATKIRPCEGATGSYRMNPDQTQGGFVASTASATASVWINPEAQVCEFAELSGEVKITDRAKIFGRAKLSGNITVSGVTEVFGNATLLNDPFSSDMLISDAVKIFGSAYLYGSLLISDSTQIFGRAQVLDFVQVTGTSRICGNSIVDGSIILVDDTTLCNAGAL